MVPNSTSSHPPHAEQTDNVFTFSPQFQLEMEDAPPDEIETIIVSGSSATEDGEEDDHVFLENRRLLIEADGEARLQALVYFRRLVPGDIEHSIPRILRAGLVPIMVDYLQKDDEPALQLEAACALKNVSAGDSSVAQHVVSAGAIPVYMRLLAKENADLIHLVFWALGNLAHESPTIRDLILAEGVVPFLVLIGNRSWESNLKGLQTYAMVLTDFCGREPLQQPHVVEPLIPVLKNLLYTNQDDDIVRDVCLSFTYLVGQGPHMKDAVLQTGIATRLVSLLTGPSTEQMKAGLRLIGEILIGSGEQTQHMLDAGVIPALVYVATLNLPEEQQHDIQREAYWALSSFTVGTEAQANAVLEALTEKLPVIVDALIHSEEVLLRKEVLTMFSNAFPVASLHHIDHLMGEFQFAWILCEELRLREMETTSVALVAIHRLLARAKEEGFFDRYANEFVELGAFEVLGQQQMDADVDVLRYNGTLRIMGDFFLAKDEGEGGEEEEGEAEEEEEEVES